MEYYQYAFLLFITSIGVSMIKDYIEESYFQKKKVN